jgi:hypothetical protein
MNFFSAYIVKKVHQPFLQCTVAVNHKAVAAFGRRKNIFEGANTLQSCLFSFNLSSLCVAGSVLSVFFDERSLSKGNINICSALTFFFLSFYFVLSHLSTFQQCWGGEGEGEGEWKFGFFHHTHLVYEIIKAISL